MPRSVVPGHQKRRLAQRFQTLADPVEELSRHRAYWLAINKPQPDLFLDRAIGDRAIGLDKAKQDTVRSQRLRVGVVLGHRLLDDAQGFVVGSPGEEVRSGQATPPSLILEAQGPVRMPSQETNQAIASPFFRVYSGSGLTIHPP